MRATEFLIERISSQVFHYTRVATALKILQSGQFELSHTLGTSWEAQFAPKGYPYFLSTTRTRHGGYHGYLGQDAVLFELDGDFYNQRYPGKAVDYWNNRDPMKDHHKAHEAEDRIFSRENAIPAAIKVIDLYIAPDADEAARARTRQVIILAKKAGIPVNLFNDQAAWRIRDTRKTADVGQLKGQDPARGYVSRRRGGYLKPWMELMQAKTKAQLSKDADRKRYDLQYTYDKQGLTKSLAVDLSNARKPGPDPDRNNAIRIIQFMQQNRLSTVDDFVNFLADKWKNIKEGVTKESSQPSFNIFSRDDFETSFEIELTVDGKDVGFFAYQYFPETNDVENDSMIYTNDFRGQGYGKMLLVKAIETAQQHDLPFKIDRNGVTPAQLNVYKSLLNNRVIRMSPDKTITLTSKEGVAEGVKDSINEIGYSDQLGNLNIPDSKIIASAEQVGTISQQPVMKYDQGNTTLFFFNNNDKITALILISDENKLRAIKNFSDQSGQIYALMNYIVNIDNRRLVVTADEPLTKEGFEWVSRLIKTPSGLKVSDLNGDPIDIDALRKEWQKSQEAQGTESGKTGIIIGESSLEWKEKLQENESRLMPHIYFNVKALKEDRNPVYQLPELTLILDPHFIERMGTRQLNSRVVAQLMSRLKNLTQELSRFEPGQKIWVNSPSLKVKLGMRRQMDRNGKMTYLLKTVVKNPTWDNPDPTVATENFADGKVKGRSRPGRVKRAGASCDGSVTDLRAKAKKYGGEKGKMYHWCANMKSGRSK